MTGGPADPSGALRPALRYAGAIALVAIGAAAFAIAFRAVLRFVYAQGYGAHDVVDAFQHLPLPWRLFIPTAGGLLAGLASIVATRLARGHGVGDVMESVALGGVHISLRHTLAKVTGSLFAIVSGGSVGREGPLIQFGGALGEATGRVFGVGADRGRVLVAAGSAAGFAAAYNTPFAAVLFVLEVVAGVAALDAVLPTIITTTIATLITRAAVGGGPIYGERAFTMLSNWELLAYAALGVLAALAAQTFMSLLRLGETWFASSRVPQPWRAALGGLGIGVLALWMPEVVGNGYEPLERLLGGGFALDTIALLLVAKAVATVFSVSSGSPGGVFTPSLLLGATLGALVGAAMEVSFGHAHVGSAGAYALVGMAAMTAATTHAPMMAAVLVFELSGDYAIVVPLLLATAIATTLSRAIRPESIYGAELRRRGLRLEMTLEGRRVARDPP